ncbi:MAG: chorismate synthase [Clostridiales bacterium]|nr:chorismate synthase [Clostridiales bacterium]
MTPVFGEKLKIELYGTSHGPCVGVRMSGVPAGLSFDMQKLQAFLDRRAPGRNEWSTQRKEADVPRFLSGVEKKTSSESSGAHIYITDGGVIEAVIDNRDARSEDYREITNIPRPGHADYPAWVKYGQIEPGGGAFSARMTAPLCIAGGLCMQWLSDRGIEVKAHISSIGDVYDAAITEDAAVQEAFPVIDEEKGQWMKKLIAGVREVGDSIGGAVECMITGLSAGVGEPVFGSVESRICQAVFAVPAVKGIEFGAGFAASRMKGSENNDPYAIKDGKIVTTTNHHGGILGGLSTGMPVVFRVAMKPTPSIGTEQDSVDLERMEPAKITVGGRHDPCIVPRAVPCVEAAAAIAVCDMLLEVRSPVGLKDHRTRIDRVDEAIVKLLDERFAIVQDVAMYKEREGLPVLDSSREQEKLTAIARLCSDQTDAYIAEIFKGIMAQSRRYQEHHKSAGAGGPAYGLLGRKLGHTYSPQIHRLIGDYDFGVFEREPEELDAFFRDGNFKGITVTMPYKKEVMRYCSELSERAKACGSVNTIIKRADGTYFGDNTDYYGFRSTVLTSGVEVKGAKAIVLGSGGVSGTVVRVLEDLGADPVVVISRNGADNYENLDRHYDAQIVVNTTPVGMYPKAGEAVIDIRPFMSCRAVYDLIYNPLRTKLMLDARSAGIPAFSGLHMLAAQAVKAYEQFMDEKLDAEAVTQRVKGSLQWDIENIVLIGMPGCGKTTVGRRVAELTGKDFIDCDEMIQEIYGRSPEDIIRAEGIDQFRSIETEVIRQVMRRSPQPDGITPGIVFATGGGCVEREENLVPLLENSLVVYLEWDLDKLEVNGRPVSQKEGVAALFERRKGRYESWCDLKVAANPDSEGIL